MIVVDTSIWIDHLNAGDPELTRLLNAQRVMMHPWVVGELALGNLAQRDAVLTLLGQLPQLMVATHHEVLSFIEVSRLSGRGVGYVDVHLLAAVRLDPGASLWTRDRRLAALAREMDVAHEPSLD